MIRTRCTHGILLLGILSLAAVSAGCAGTGTRSGSGSAGAGDTGDANYVARAETEKSEELICRREQPTGSRIAERVCMTAEDWEKIAEQSQEMLDRSTRKSQQYNDQ
ncbi:MAG: hypothetical protein ACWGPN_12640 [Gammaproteobacteria bacterium]